MKDMKNMTNQIIERIHVELGTVIDPELRRPSPELGMIESVFFAEGIAQV